MEAVPSDVAVEFTPGVPEEVPEEVLDEVSGIPELQAELPAEAPAVIAEIGTSHPPRVRKVRIKEPPPPPKANLVYWGDRLQEHRTTQRLERDQRYRNQRIT